MNISKKITCSLIAVLAVAMIAPIGQAAEEEWAGDPYTLSTCPVSGEPLTVMGKPIIELLDGREVRYCCSGCPKQLKADAETHFKKIDAMLIADQLAAYPLNTCIVSGEEIEKDGGVSFIVANRLFRTCCTNCQKKVVTNPSAHIAKLNEAVIAAQEKTYALKTCPVSGGSLTAMGEPVSMVLANRLVKLCCNECKAKLAADPAKFISMIDVAAGRSELKHHEDGDAGHAEGAGAEHGGHDAGGESAHSE